MVAPNTQSERVLPPLPRAPTRGRIPVALKAEWLDVVELLMARGIDTPTELAGLTGLTRRTARAWMDEIYSRWDARRSTTETVRRELELFAAADRISAVALRTMQTAKHPPVVVAAMKVALASLDRKMALLGIRPGRR